MNILYVYAHPHAASFNDVLKQQALETLAQLACEVTRSDLYTDEFNPVASWDDFTLDPHQAPSQYFLAQQHAYQHQQLAMDIRREIDKLAWADHIIFQFPLWWFSMPAILKGWFDRILLKGFAYDSGHVFETGLLQGKTASLTVTTQSPASAYQANGMHQATIEQFLLPIHHMLRFTGIKTQPPFVVHEAYNLDTEKSNLIVKNYIHYLQQHFSGDGC